MWAITTSTNLNSTTTTNPTTTTTLSPTDSYYGANISFPTWGNVYPATLGDCTFAAAANWEVIIKGMQPDPATIGYEFSQAGGTADGGLTMDALFSYWLNPGIAGYAIGTAYPLPTNPASVESAVQTYGALIVSFNFIAGDYMGNQQVDPGGHAAVVDGFTPQGPRIVTWGDTIQMSWQQWNAEVDGLWAVGNVA